MADPKRHDSLNSEEGVIRDSQIETLLVDGLELYFKGRYDEAIHLWTRVLFIDRGDQRARAYIERAQSAIAERQRRGDELLHASQELLDQGQTTAARDLLDELVSMAGDDERAAALRLKLDRIERMRPAPAPAAHTEVPMPEIDEPWRPGRYWAIVGTATATALVVLAVVAFNPTVRSWVGLSASADAIAVKATPVALPVLSTSDVALVRARTFYGRGRLAEALQALDRVGVESASRGPADELRVEIQRLLLASAAQRTHGGGRP